LTVCPGFGADRRVVNDLPPEDRDIAMLFQELPALPVHDHVRLALNPERLHSFDIKTQLSI
jgi:ABC-type Fe3+/spermidine/putrescine transport system ATPase subunit